MTRPHFILGTLRGPEERRKFPNTSMVTYVAFCFLQMVWLEFIFLLHGARNALQMLQIKRLTFGLDRSRFLNSEDLTAVSVIYFLPVYFIRVSTVCITLALSFVYTRRSA